MDKDFYRVPLNISVLPPGRLTAVFARDSIEDGENPAEAVVRMPVIGLLGVVGKGALDSDGLLFDALVQSPRNGKLLVLSGNSFYSPMMDVSLDYCDVDDFLGFESEEIKPDWGPAVRAIWAEAGTELRA